MKNLACIAHFNSDYYAEFLWKNIFNEAEHALFHGKYSIALINAKGLAMTTDAVFVRQRINLLFENNDIVLDGSDVIPIKNAFFQDEGIYFYRLNMHENQSSGYSDEYKLFIKKLIQITFEKTEIIFLYTQNHLSKRTYGHHDISRLEVVQNDFADIIALIESYKVCFLNDFNDIFFACGLLLDVLNRIAKLSGARAVLKNHVLNLCFHVKMLQKFVINL